MAKKLDPDGPFLATQAEVAWVFGVHTQTVKQWLGDGMPGERGKYGVRAIRIWKEGRKKDPVVAGVAADESDQLRRRVQLARVRVEEAEADARELKNRKASGEMLERAGVRQLFALMIAATRKRLEQLPGTIKTMLPRELQRIVADELSRQVSLVLVEMSDWQPDKPEK